MCRCIWGHANSWAKVFNSKACFNLLQNKIGITLKVNFILGIKFYNGHKCLCLDLNQLPYADDDGYLKWILSVPSKPFRATY